MHARIGDDKLPVRLDIRVALVVVAPVPPCLQRNRVRGVLPWPLNSSLLLRCSSKDRILMQGLDLRAPRSILRAPTEVLGLEAVDKADQFL